MKNEIPFIIEFTYIHKWMMKENLGGVDFTEKEKTVEMSIYKEIVEYLEYIGFKFSEGLTQYEEVWLRRVYSEKESYGIHKKIADIYKKYGKDVVMPDHCKNVIKR